MLGLVLSAPGAVLAQSAATAGVVAAQFRWLTFTVFGAIIALTIFVTHLAARRVKDAQQFYAAGRSICGIQNGWAIAGDCLSTASFLGIAGLISLYGYDGFMYSVGWLVAYITVSLLIAEPCRNIGKYTLGDIRAFRDEPKKAETVAEISTITVSIFYLTAQMVGGGVLVKTLIGIDYEVSVIAVGVLMLAYVIFGGMVATTWVQIIKAMLLVTASLILVFFTWLPYGFWLPGFLQAAVGDRKIQAQVGKLLGDPATQMTAAELGQRFLEPGLYLNDPIDQIWLGMALVLGTAGMPHILMRLFTVPTAKDARTSVLWAMGIIAGFSILTLFLGLGAAINVGAGKISAIEAGGNMAGPLLGQQVGGGADSVLGNLFPAFVAAVAFATIVAVVAGLVLASACAMCHDIWVGVIKGERAAPGEEVHAARISSLMVGVIAIVIGIAAKVQNVAHLVALAFAVAASSNLPAVLLTLYWKKCHTGGMVVGAVTAIGLVMVSPNMTYPATVRASRYRAGAGDSGASPRCGNRRHRARSATAPATAAPRRRTPAPRRARARCRCGCSARWFPDPVRCSRRHGVARTSARRAGRECSGDRAGGAERPSALSVYSRFKRDFSHALNSPVTRSASRSRSRSRPRNSATTRRLPAASPRLSCLSDVGRRCDPLALFGVEQIEGR